MMKRIKRALRLLSQPKPTSCTDCDHLAYGGALNVCRLADWRTLDPTQRPDGSIDWNDERPPKWCPW